MSNHSTSPLSPSSMLKLLRAQGPGAKVELQPEHMAAFDAALLALHFQSQVRHLVQNGPHSLSSNPSGAGPRPAQSARPDGPKHDERPAREPRESRPQEARASKSSASSPPKPSSPIRPTEGSGAIWTPEEESKLRGLWGQGIEIAEVAGAHKRSAAACFSRLIRIKSVTEGEATTAALFLIKRKQPVSLSGAGGWLAEAIAQGFGSLTSAAEPSSQS